MSNLKKITHSHKMLSLDKTKDIGEIIYYFLTDDQPYIAMCKMDGLTCSLTYENGELVSAETRGDGIVGEDVLHNAKVIKSIPKSIPYIERLVIDGEIICKKDDFAKFENEYKNPRNFAAGSIRLLDAKECANRDLTFVAWDVIEGFNKTDSLMTKLKGLERMGFIIVPALYREKTIFRIVENDIESMEFIAKQLNYPIDGVVFKFDSVKYGKSLGQTEHHFKNAIAYKFGDELYDTELIDIEWSMGRTGVLSPIAIFKPVDIDGTTVERASLHNVSIMYETLGNNLHKGQKIKTFKANMIIPQIAWADQESQGETFEIPNICPVCGGETEIRKDIGATLLVCTNPNCSGKLINRLDHFCGKKGLDIKGLSKATLEKLIDWGWVFNFTDLFQLAQYTNDWTQKAGFGQKSVMNILTAIENSRNCDLDKFITALGIPLIGSTASKALVKEFTSWNDFRKAINTGYKFYNLSGFGDEMHNSIMNFDYTEADNIAENFISFNSFIESAAAGSAVLEGKTFVITGKLSHFKNRDALKSTIESLGGKVTGSVSKNTDYLINNDIQSTSSKNATAKQLGIPIMSEEDFVEVFKILD